jgi:hypothetical protein
VIFYWSKGFKLEYENEACFSWESIAYRSRLPAFDQKGLIGHVKSALTLGYEEKEYL